MQLLLNSTPSESTIEWDLTKQYKIARGSFCLFIAINKEIGIKVYINKRSRDRAYRNQARAAKHGVGPAVGGKFDITNAASSEALHITKYGHYMWRRKRAPFYGYLTQIAQIPPDGISDEQFCTLVAKMRGLGFNTGDLRETHNTGLVHGEPVCIDFDPVSMGCDE